jgi:hypothetical protein
MNDRSDQIATICECIDHCFAFEIWCDDFAKSVDPEDMICLPNSAEHQLTTQINLPSWTSAFVDIELRDKLE